MIVEVYTDASTREDAYSVSYQIYSDKYCAICRKYYKKKNDNNIAEMMAIEIVLKHLSFLYRCRGFEITIYTDNKNAAELMNKTFISDKYKKNKKELANLIPNFKSCEFVHVKAHTKKQDVHSKRNCLADKLCRESHNHKNSKFYLLYNYNDKN